MASPTPAETLDKLYPLPAPAEIQLVPPPKAGMTNESQKTLVKCLKDNHEKHHIFFNDKGFHNHATHHLYAIYTLGAPPEVIDAAYQTHVDYQRAAFDSPGEITEANWKDHLGNENYYRSYLTFFSKNLLANGTKATLDKFIFDPSSNWTDMGTNADAKKQPQMLNRLLSGVLHPLIHVGYGCEFGAPGMVAEGLAMACAQRNTDFDEIVPKSLFVNEQGGHLLSKLTSKLTLDSKPSATTKAAAGLHSFTIVRRVLEDPELAPGAACIIPRPGARNDDTSTDGGFPMIAVLKNKGDIILKYSEMWTINGEDPAEVKQKMEELAWVATMIYGVAGLQEGKNFNGDFFLMHLVTSSLFLPSFIPILSPSSISNLLQTYLAIALTVWVARGRPAIPIASFYERSSPNLPPPGPKPTPARGTLAPETSIYPNAWLPILQSTILHPNEHLCKLQRALAHYSALYGLTEAGNWKKDGIELEGAEKLDGTLFARVAGLTMGRLGWLREGQQRGEWDFDGLWPGVGSPATIGKTN